ncbi:MAG: ABC transporter ATP-binding protein, partial [Myxococcota bacterium]|nr:ABC transporter ATP-binding protein [Myxococcota bacterium]
IDLPALSLAGREQVALHGRSGCGKTTLLHLIAGILRPDAGRILVADEEITAHREADRDRLRGKLVGYVFQSFNLLAAYSALENVLLAMHFGADEDEDRARHLLERVGLADRMHYRPAQLSLGQRQRVAVARALANRPALVLADEPTGNLDPANAASALTLLRETAGEMGAALLLVSHDQEILRAFERCEDFDALARAGMTS